MLEQLLTRDRTFLGEECCRDECGRVDAQDLSQLRYLVNGWALQPAFQRAQIRSATNVRKVFLGEAPLPADIPKDLPKRDVQFQFSGSQKEP